jgi:glycosyltransferase involved in cell wall biosynthesis
MYKVSIIIPSYNSAHFLPETLESVFNQDCGDYELIVVDDGSTDNTRELIESYGNRITYLYQENSGACSKPRNEGINIAKGEYISIFDSDDIMKPDKIRLQANFLDNNPDVGFVFTDFCDVRGKVVSHNHVGTCPLFNRLNKQKVGKNEYIIDKTDSYETLLSENFVGASSMVFRKNLFEDIGPFDESLDSSEDIDFTLRVARKYNLGFVDKICHLRRLHDGNMTTKAEKMFTRSLRVFSSQLGLPKSPKAQQRLIDKIADFHGSLAYHYRENARYRDALGEYRATLNLRPYRFRIYMALVKLAIMALAKGSR